MIEPIYEFVPPTKAKEIWCAKCQNHRPAQGHVEYLDGSGRLKRACERHAGLVKRRVRK